MVRRLAAANWTMAEKVAQNCCCCCCCCRLSADNDVTLINELYMHAQRDALMKIDICSNFFLSLVLSRLAQIIDPACVDYDAINDATHGIYRLTKSCR